MEGHVKTVGILHIALGALGVIGALVVVLIFGGAAALVDFNAPEHEARIAVPIIGVAGGAIAIFILVLSVPGIVVGIGLYGLRPWARTFGILISALDLVNVPLGTALGIYSLWVLMHSQT